MKTKLWGCILGAAVLAGCVNDVAEMLPKPSNKLVIRAGREAACDEKTRAGYNGRHAVWHAGDDLRVFLNDANKIVRFDIKPGSISADGTYAEFEGVPTVPVTGIVSVTACFPYLPYGPVLRTDVVSEFPDVQVYDPDGYRGLPLFARYDGPVDDLHLTFRNPFSVIALNLAKDPSLDELVKVRSIIFRGNADETVAGSVKIDLSGDEPAVDFTGSCKMITLLCGEGVELTEVPQLFYIAIPAIEFKKGYTFEVRTNRKEANVVILKAKGGGVTSMPNTICRTPLKRITASDFRYTIPDGIFRNKLVQKGYVRVLDTTTGEVALTNAGRIATELDCSNPAGNINNYIRSLAGIEYFGAIEKFTCYLNKLKTLDLSGNTVLRSVNCVQNELIWLDISSCAELEALYCSYNALRSLDLSANTRLQKLDCSYNYNLPEVKGLAGNDQLVSADFQHSGLRRLNITGCSSLSKLIIFSNEMQELDASSMADPSSYTLYCGSQTNPVTGQIQWLTLTLRGEQQARWTGTLASSYPGNYRVTVVYSRN